MSLLSHHQRTDSLIRWRDELRQTGMQCASLAPAIIGCDVQLIEPPATSKSQSFGKLTKHHQPVAHLGACLI